MKHHNSSFLKSKFGDVSAYTFIMKVKDLVQIHYIAVRGIDDEQGAVQRILNKRRIESIKKYILDGNQFFSSFIINWAEPKIKVEVTKTSIKIPLIAASAQVIDGQHRLAGLEAAIEENEKIGEHFVIVTMCLGLNTSQAAKIFLNINTEQKQVPKSLAYDLFGEAFDDPNHSINRATDIARELNDDTESPFYKLIKYPGSPRGVGSIELSTFVNAVKPHLEKDGKMQAVKLVSLKHQKTALDNFFKALKNAYVEQDMWASKSKNPFLKAAGFNGAVDYFAQTLLMKCAELKSFKPETIEKILNLANSELLTQEDLKGTDGKSARKKVHEYLEANLLNKLPDQHDYEF